MVTETPISGGNDTGLIVQKICFIAHNATRTGAPVVLYHFVKWLKENTGHQLEVWFLEEGEMVQDFKKICTCTIAKKGYRSQWKNRFARGLEKMAEKDLLYRQRLKALKNFDLLFFNTIAAFGIIPLLSANAKGKRVAWLHEQPFSLNAFYKHYLTKENVSFFDKMITVSSQTQVYLRECFGKAAPETQCIPPFIDASRFGNVNRQESTESLPENRPFLVGACGLQDWRKGPDLFLQVARLIRKNYPDLNIHFQWIGAESGMTEALKYEITQLDLQDVVEFTGARENASLFFARFDVFLLTSREDPFPLVVLEACTMRKPVICFHGIGDITEVVGKVSGNLVSYGDIEKMAERLVFYYTNRCAVETDGKLLEEKVQAYHVEKIAPQLYRQLFDDAETGYPSKKID